MKSVLEFLLAFIITAGMIMFTIIVMILNNIEEFVEWLEKRINKR